VQRAGITALPKEGDEAVARMHAILFLKHLVLLPAAAGQGSLRQTGSRSFSLVSILSRLRGKVRQLPDLLRIKVEEDVPSSVESSTIYCRLVEKRMKIVHEGDNRAEKPRVELVGEDGNVFNVIGQVLRTLNRAGAEGQGTGAPAADAGRPQLR